MSKYLRDWPKEIEERSKWIKDYVTDARAKGVGLGLSGGKDSVIVSYLCKKANVKTLGISMPIGNNKEDENVAKKYAEMLGVEFYTKDLSESFNSMVKELETINKVEGLALANIKPRLRMTFIYAICQQRNYLVIGTGNKSEYITGYFTKWGDGAYDLNPIFDLTVTELFDLMKYIDENEEYDFKEILNRVPSGGLYEGQTDEKELGISYAKIDSYIRNEADEDTNIYLDKMYKRTMHKRNTPARYNK